MHTLFIRILFIETNKHACQLTNVFNVKTLISGQCKTRTNMIALTSYDDDYYTHTHTHTRLTALFSGTTRVGQYQKGKTNLDFTEARDSEWQWHQLGHVQVCTSLQTDNHARTPPLSFLQAGCPSCCPTNSVKALKVNDDDYFLFTN